MLHLLRFSHLDFLLVAWRHSCINLLLLLSFSHLDNSRVAVVSVYFLGGSIDGKWIVELLLGLNSLVILSCEVSVDFNSTKWAGSWNSTLFSEFDHSIDAILVEEMLLVAAKHSNLARRVEHEEADGALSWLCKHHGLEHGLSHCQPDVLDTSSGVRLLE